MRLLFISILTFISLVSRAQQPGGTRFSVIQHKPAFFTFTDAEQLLSGQSINGVFELKLNPGSQNLNVYAQLLFDRQVSASMMNQLALRMSYSSSSAVRAGNSEITLATSPTLLFKHPANITNLPQQHSFLFDLVLKPFTNFVKPDSHNFSIVFTITPE